MGRLVDLDQPLSEEDKAYLKRRGRGYLIPANERRFAEGGNPGEKGANSPFYDSAERAKAVYDQGGAPLPGTTLDYDTGRVADRDNGVFVEPNPPLNSPGHYAARVDGGFYSSPDEGEIDDDIVEEVQAISNKTELKKRLESEGVEFDASASREDLEDALAIHLQDKRDGKSG